MAATKKISSKTTSGAAKGPVDKALKAKWEKATALNMLVVPVLYTMFAGRRRNAANEAEVAKA